ncbi:MAG: RnfABCDGE type electron transport complex subunit D [Euryarchaeota archaeon]|nr:RnfABCDGE type electron transport complex subunit D [Euryarchaeota archaeon]
MKGDRPLERLRVLARPVLNRLPPVRLLIIFLIVLGGTSSYLLGGAGLASLVALPMVAAATDLLFQRARFSELRVPESAIATGLFLALLLPPTVVLVEAGAVAVAAIGLRHALRLRGRPWLNPAGAGLLLGALIFGMAPAWWAAVSPNAEVLVVVLGALLAFRQPGRWRIPASFFVAYAGFAALEHFLVGGILSPRLLALSVVDPAVLFFGLFMVTEPRTAPSDPNFQPMYAIVIAIGSSFLPIFLPTVGVLFALFLGNLLAFVHRRTSPALTSSTVGIGARDAKRAKRSRAALASSIRWPVAYRAGSLVLVALVVGGVSLGTATQQTGTPSSIIATPPGLGGGGGSPGGGGTGGGISGGGGNTYANCQQDNPNIPASTVQSLHQALGPSVILSYNSNTGVVVFYDPVNQVTVTETDMYEDYGFAEFNGDDYAVSGCSG